jgi:hypothetical protein
MNNLVSEHRLINLKLCFLLRFIVKSFFLRLCIQLCWLLNIMIIFFFFTIVSFFLDTFELCNKNMPAVCIILMHRPGRCAHFRKSNPSLINL